MPTFDSSSLSRPAGSLRLVAPPAFSFMPAVIMTSAAPVRSEYSPSEISTTEESAAPYWRSVTTAFARLRSRFTTTISRAMPRRMLDNRQAEPTAPAPITPSFIRPSVPFPVHTMTGGCYAVHNPLPHARQDRRKSLRDRPWRLASRTGTGRRAAQLPDHSNGHRPWHQLPGQLLGLQRRRERNPHGNGALGWLPAEGLSDDEDRRAIVRGSDAAARPVARAAADRLHRSRAASRDPPV